jgi:flagellar biosynthesis anti-sigma factor FlgM
MTLPIDLNLSSQINTVASTTANDRTSNSAGSSGAEQLSADTANLSQISGLVAKAMEQPEVRMDKVESIQAQIAAGAYEVSPSKVADAMTTSALNKDI